MQSLVIAFGALFVIGVVAGIRAEREGDFWSRALVIGLIGTVIVPVVLMFVFDIRYGNLGTLLIGAILFGCGVMAVFLGMLLGAFIWKAVKTVVA